MIGCRSEIVSNDPSLRLTFSQDTLCFDTIFSEAGSTTARIMLYNPNRNAIVISDVETPDNSCFTLNIDGETNPDNWHDLTIRGGDSLFLFVQAKINPQNSNLPVFFEDKVVFRSNTNTDTLVLQAYGQDVIRIRGDLDRRNRRTHRATRDTITFTADRPYLIIDTLVVSNKLTILPGATIYMHRGASIFCLGDARAEGTVEAPIRILGDRRDQLFTNVPYAYAAGQWDGIYLIQDHSSPSKGDREGLWSFSHVDITSGNIGLYCWGDSCADLPTLTLRNSRIHNMALYGLVLRNTNALVENTELSNAASYCAYLSGGNHRFLHTTIASYFNATNVRIQSTAREDVAAVYINNLNKHLAADSTSFINSVIAGARANQLVVATPFDQYYPGLFRGCYLQTDSLRLPGAQRNVYGTRTDTVFCNTYYEYQVYEYYDFHLDSVSPARGIADSACVLPYNKEGTARPLPADAGCY